MAASTPATTRPPVVEALLARPLPALTPPKLGDTSNPPYREDLRNAIASLLCHPALEAAVSPSEPQPSCLSDGLIQLHLMNDDLFSAHFLLRKMQNDEWGEYFWTLNVDANRSQ